VPGQWVPLIAVAETSQIELLEVRTVPVRVHGRVLDVRPPSMAADKELLWRSRRPGWYGTREAVDCFLTRCVENASLGSIRELDDRDRRRLMLVVVRSRKCEADWRRLYGSSLGLDERFFAVMIWAREREARRLQERLVELRENLIRSNEDQVRSISEAARAAVFGKSESPAAMALFGDRIKPFSAMLDRYLYPTRSLERLLGREWVNPLAKQALELESLTTRRVLDFGSKLSLDEFESRSLGITRRLLGKETQIDFGGLLGVPLETGIADVLQPSAKSAMSAALRAFQDMYEPPWMSATVSSLVSSQLRPYFDPPRPPFGGLDLKQLSALPGMPMFSSPLERLQIKDGLSNLLPAMGIRPADLVRGAFPNLLEEFTRVSRPLVAAADFAAEWGGDPLWFLLSVLSPRHFLLLLELRREQVYQATFDALEHAIRHSDLLDAVSTAIGEVSYLTDEQRDWLVHGLEHTKTGEWVQAVPPLITGLEGALHGAALDANVIPPGPEGNLMAAEKLIKSVEFGDEFQAFAIQLAFGGRGQAFRHGRPRNASRDQALLLVVAVIGWLDYTLGSQGAYLLAHEMREPLSIAVRSFDDDEALAAA
jgi:hypothetical protein